MNGFTSVALAGLAAGGIIFGGVIWKNSQDKPEDTSKSLYDQVIEDTAKARNGETILAEAETKKAVLGGPIVGGADQPETTEAEAQGETDADWWEEQPGTTAELEMEAADKAMENMAKDAAKMADDAKDTVATAASATAANAKTEMAKGAEAAKDAAMETVAAASDTMDKTGEAAATTAKSQLRGLRNQDYKMPASEGVQETTPVRNAKLIDKPDGTNVTRNNRLIDKPDTADANDYFTEEKRFANPCLHSDGTPYTGPGTVDNPFAEENPCLSPTVYAAAVPDAPPAPRNGQPAEYVTPITNLDPVNDTLISPFVSYAVNPIGPPGPLPTLDATGGSSYRVQNPNI